LTRPLEAMRASIPFLRWFAESRFAKKQREEGIADLMFGNPQEMPLPDYVGALTGQIAPRDKAWFAYKMSEPGSTEVVARSLGARTGVDWDPADVHMTNGGFAAIAVALRTLCEPGDEVVFLSPPWFFYELLVLAAGAVPVRVPIEAPRFDLPVDAIAKALTPKTRAVLVNSPHNPSGRVWSKEDFAALAKVLDAQPNPIWILSDEAYARVVFDGRRAASPAEIYPRTFVLYSYGKQLLAPGQRVGYAALPKTLPEKERTALREDVVMAQCATGFAFPNALLQHALADIEDLTIDLTALERRRNRLVPALRELGYETTFPEGTFYLLVRAPYDEDRFVDRLADHDVFVLPGKIVELPGWIRISMTANDGMIEKAIAAFAAVRG
jgi:aspartate aminotransferase